MPIIYTGYGGEIFREWHEVNRVGGGVARICRAIVPEREWGVG